LARRSKRQSSGGIGGDEEIAVEDMVPGLEDEEMTPVPDIGSEIVIEPEEEVEEQEEAEEGYEEGEEEIEAGPSDEVEVEAEAKEADEDDKFPPGTLGKSLSNKAGPHTDGIVWAKCKASVPCSDAEHD
jgi:hypothetical protein